MGAFNMPITELKSGETDTVKPINGQGIMFMTSGQGTMKAGGKTHEVKAGYIYFIGQGVEVSFESSSADFAVYRAYTE